MKGPPGSTRPPRVAQRPMADGYRQAALFRIRRLVVEADQAGEREVADELERILVTAIARG